MVKFPAELKNRKSITLLTTARLVVPILYQMNSIAAHSLHVAAHSPHVAAHSPHFFQINSGYGLDDRGLESRQGQKIYLLSNRRVQTKNGAHPGSYSMDKGPFPQGGDPADSEANTNLQLLPTLRSSGAISPLHHMPG